MWNPLNRLFTIQQLFFLIFGGILYSIGAIVYATRFPDILPHLVSGISPLSIQRNSHLSCQKKSQFRVAPRAAFLPCCLAAWL